MTFFLRLVGITNVALWFGAGVVLAGVVGPIFASRDMLQILPVSHSGAAAHIVLSRCLVVQSWCGAIALVHLLVESLYAGKPLHRWPIYLVLGLLGLALFNGLSVQPKLQRLHLETYGIRSTPQQREQAKRATAGWKDTLHVTQLLLLLGVWLYLWEIANTDNAAKFLGPGKFRS